MKRFAVVLLGLFCCFSLTGCFFKLFSDDYFNFNNKSDYDVTVYHNDYPDSVYTLNKLKSNELKIDTKQSNFTFILNNEFVNIKQIDYCCYEINNGDLYNFINNSSETIKFYSPLNDSVVYSVTPGASLNKHFKSDIDLCFEKLPISIGSTIADFNYTFFDKTLVSYKITNIFSVSIIVYYDDKNIEILPSKTVEIKSYSSDFTFDYIINNEKIAGDPSDLIVTAD